MYRVGIDVGGTNTDAVMMRGREVICGTKTATTHDVTGGVLEALSRVLRESGVTPADLGAVMIGTTHFTNAVVERRELSRVGVLRLALPASSDIPPLSGWPADLVEAINPLVRLSAGGYEFDGREISGIDTSSVVRFAEECAKAGIRYIAISGVFSPLVPDQELEAADLIRKVLPDAHITLSSSLGNLGLLERENASILNAALVDLGKRISRSFAEAMRTTGVVAPFFLTQNDGTLIAAERVADFPILTVASGPTNSMRGAAFLSGTQDAIVVDIGGTTSDVGLLQKGFPRMSGVTVEVGGVRTNFRMPDVHCIGLGGGSHVDLNAGTFGPRSVGYRLYEKALVFGGDVLTASDIAVAAGIAGFGEAALVAHLDASAVRRAVSRMQDMVATAVDRMRVSDAPIPVLVVGGGSVLLSGDIDRLPTVRPPSFEVANAVGAAIAQIGAEIDHVYRFSDISRDEAIADATARCRQKVIDEGGVADTVETIDIEDTPLAYLPGKATRIRVKMVGDLQL
ncbi:hydantoinase/oxoprolinase N-terminal domain-containing protein [Pseudomonas sp. GM60]|uniref:hydantoinase/oxoprolinase N-terminal domain-containing protein n=1 Tax=Pseudomonas sp. GM60 TaxID=1144334 RepID=UPI000270657B|nr:hydantoinase/oxoprolinase family protein [Pseudomonas sp. GM60]EJM88551.1 N-methylhydantoinase A/acetone carboxylase, beta subunit [Pseudomonas sp. GM60]